MAQRLPFLTRLQGMGGLQDQPVRVPQDASSAPLSGLRAAAGSQPWRTREELYKAAYSRPVQAVGPVPGSPGEFDDASYDPVGEPNRRAALDELTRLREVEFSGEDAQRKRVEDFRQAQQDASMGGFETPLQQSLYERRIAEEKMRQPIEQQRIVGQTQRDVTQMQGQNTIEAEKLRQRGALDLQDRYNEFYRMLTKPSDDSAAPPVSGFTLPGQRGGGGVRFDTNPQAPQVVAPQLKTQLTTAAANLKQNPTPANEMAYNMAAAATLDDAMRRGLVRQQVGDMVRSIVSDPNLREQSIQQLLPNLSVQHDDGSEAPLNPADPEDMKLIQELNQALLLVRGL